MGSLQIIGVDPGKGGAVVRLLDSGVPVEVAPMPLVASTRGRDEYDERTLADMFRLAMPVADQTVVVYEALTTLPRSMGGGAANFGRGMAVGLIRGICAGACIASMAVRPQAWQREMLEGTPGEDTKQKAIIAAGRLFPGVCLVCFSVGGLHHPHGRRTKPQDGAADALLLAEHVRRKMTKPAAVVA